MPKLEFQVVMSKNGHLLGKTEWSEDKEAVIELQTSINDQCRDIRAIVETRGSASISIPGPVSIGGAQ